MDITNYSLTHVKSQTITSEHYTHISGKTTRFILQIKTKTVVANEYIHINKEW